MNLRVTFSGKVKDLEIRSRSESESEQGDKSEGVAFASNISGTTSFEGFPLAKRSGIIRYNNDATKQVSQIETAISENAEAILVEQVRSIQFLSEQPPRQK